MAVQLPGQLCFFVIGSLTYHYYPWFLRCRHWIWTGAIVSYLLSLYLGWITFRAIGVGLGVMCVGLLASIWDTKYKQNAARGVHGTRLV